jgi:hypothetical protein
LNQEKNAKQLTFMELKAKRIQNKGLWGLMTDDQVWSVSSSFGNKIFFPSWQWGDHLIRMKVNIIKRSYHQKEDKMISVSGSERNKDLPKSHSSVIWVS